MITPKIAAREPAVLTLEAGTYYWCRCGLAQSQPFCDGSHQGTDLSPLEFKLEESATVALCQCKHTATPPRCDGSHLKLPG